MSGANQLAGLVVSVLLYVAALGLGLRARRGLERRMPPAMRERLPEDDVPTVCGVLAEWRRSAAWGWLLTFVLAFAIAFGVDLSFAKQVLFVGAVAGIFAIFGLQDDRAALQRSAAGFDVEGRLLTAPWVATTVMSWLGWSGIAAFVAGLVVLTVR